MTSWMGTTSSNRGNPDQKMGFIRRCREYYLPATNNNKTSFQDQEQSISGFHTRKLSVSAVQGLDLQKVKPSAQTSDWPTAAPKVRFFFWWFRQAPNVKIASASEFNPVLVLNEPQPHPWDAARLEQSLANPRLSEFSLCGCSGHDTRFMKQHTKQNHDKRNVQ